LDGGSSVGPIALSKRPDVVEARPRSFDHVFFCRLKRSDRLPRPVVTPEKGTIHATTLWGHHCRRRPDRLGGFFFWIWYSSCRAEFRGTRLGELLGQTGSDRHARRSPFPDRVAGIGPGDDLCRVDASSISAASRDGSRPHPRKLSSTDHCSQ